MYKILIVDDELIERKGLNKILTKEFKDILEIELAFNGKNAIEKAKSFKPDIIFMDIKMPGINGIEAMKIIKQDLKDVNVVIISAFDSFKYAQAAINNNAYEYLLKPVKRKDILNCVRRLMKFHDEKIKEKEKKEFLKNANIKSLEVIKENIIEYITNNNISKIKQLKNIGLDIISYNSGVSGIIEVDNNKEIREFISNYLDENYNKCILKNLNNYILFFFEDENKEYKKEFRNLYKTILNKFDRELKIEFGKYESIDSIYTTYKNNLRNLYGDEIIKDEYIYPINLENELIEKINLSILNESLEILNKIFIWIDKYIKNDSKKKRYLTELEILINRTLYDKLDETKILKPIEIRDEFKENELMIIKKEMKDKLTKNINRALDESNSNVEEVINKAKIFISNNYMKDITLDLVASEMCISPYYFSKLFKKEAGINFIEYLTNERINNAKYMIRNTNKSIKQISSEIGYNDPNYFSRVFKKHTGYSPSKYKKI